MNSRQRMLATIEGQVPDRLPVTTHHLMPYFLNKYMDGISNEEFFNYFGLDPIFWTSGVLLDKGDGDTGTSQWRVESEDISNSQCNLIRYSVYTPKGTLSLVLQTVSQTAWVVEHLIKKRSDIDILGEFYPVSLCDLERVNCDAEQYGGSALIRGYVCGFDLFGQPGCWQDACCLVGTERLIIETYNDPEWVHQLLKILLERKKAFIRSTKGARYDILELGGGAASTTVISPTIFDQFVAPYDSALIQLAHDVDQRIVYHTCGGMMPILENIAAMQPDAMETFTPAAMGGDTDLGEAKKRIGDKVCMIGGFDQYHYFQGCSPEETRAAVRRCFEQAGENGGYILAPSDHFFDAEVALIKVFAEEARRCTY